MKDLSQRTLCSDGNCIGTINEDGVCTVCGRKIGKREKIEVEEREEKGETGEESGIRRGKSTFREYLMAAGLVLCICAAVWGFQETFSLDYEELTKEGDGITLVECRYPLGSVFHRNKISFRGSDLIVYEQSFFQQGATTLPYSQVKRVLLSEGAYWGAVTVERPGFWGNKATLYFKKKETEMTIMETLKSVAPELVIVEEQTLFRKIMRRSKKDNR